MYSSDVVAWPPAWQDETRPRKYFAFGWLLFVTLAAAAIAIYFVQADRYEDAKYIIVFTLMLMVVVYFGYQLTFRKKRGRTSPLRLAKPAENSAAICVPYSRQVFTGWWLAMLLAALLFAMIAADSVRFREGRPQIAAIIIPGLLSLLFLSQPLIVILGKFRRGYLLVSPHGIYQRGWTFRSYLPWSSITRVTPYPYGRPEILIVAPDESLWERKQITKLWRQDRLPRIPKDEHEIRAIMEIPARFLAADPAVVLYMLCYYADHPEARHELGTEAALQRARTGAFG